MDLIITDTEGREQGYLNCISVDIENGDKNDFEIVLNRKNYNKIIHSPGCRIFCPNTEWGGIIDTIHPSGDLLYLNGPTWRGRLDKSIVEPDEGEDYLVLTGELNSVIKQVMERQGLKTLFKAINASSGYKVTNYQFPRYYSALEGITSMLKSVGHKPVFRYIRSVANSVGYVEINAVKIIDRSEKIEIGNDMQMKYDIKVNHGVPNHMICLGSGQLEERLVVHLYMNQYGQIVDQPYYTGLDKIDTVYNYSGQTDVDKLREDGIKRFREVTQKVTSKAYMVTNDISVNIGDIVSGRERITGIKVRVPVIRKIYKRTGTKETYDYKLKGE